MIITIKKLAEKIKHSENTVRTYLCRTEFSHLQWSKVKKADIIKGLTDEDIKLLKKFIKRKRACV
jgi:hypothetical protein